MDMPSWMPVTSFAISLMVFLGVYAWIHMDDSIGRQPFVMMTALTALMLISDLISRCYIFSGAPHLVIAGATAITFLLLPAIGAEWYQYIRSVLVAEERIRMNRLTYVANALAAVGIIAVLLTPITSWVYSFDSAGVYHRGDYFILPASVTFLILIVTDAFLLTQVHSIERYSIRMLGAFPIPAFIGAAFAIVIPDVPWIPLGFSVSVVALFAHIQNTGMGRDYLTGLHNRKKLEELMEERLERARGGHPFAAIMMDLDDFKLINDTLGHSVGDIALAETARLLQRSVRAGDAIARFGGDEFFVLLDLDSDEELQMVVDRINEEERLFAEKDNRFVLQLSKGYDFFDANRFASIAEFETHLDELMYEEKQRHHAEGVAGAKLYASVGDGRKGRARNV